ncbi:alpha 1,2-mannosyltransferase 2.4.1 [Gaertneriomyces sp. JEL0708]|nr:alpha 1,2-mannosyltransferase 2.4.1 [Gaertneriomyces sp. JEL0708]
MIGLPRGRTVRSIALAALLLATVIFLKTALSDDDGILDVVKNRLKEDWWSKKETEDFRLRGISENDRQFAALAGIHIAPLNATDDQGRVKGVLLMLARNSDLNGAKDSVQDLQKRFNNKYNYPYVYLNDQPFDENFKSQMRALTPNSKVEFGLVPREHWSYPEWINQTYAAETRKKMEEDKVIYGGSESYRHMCRFNSGFFFRHPLLDQYDYYWRVEPNVKFSCDIPLDPFKYIHENNKLYSFTISLYEYEATIPTLWKTVKEFVQKNPSYVRSENALSFITDDKMSKYNMCHFWSNFEIASLHLWRSKAYLDFFEFLDREGGFFYERWGDAPVHSIAAAFLLRPEQIHFFNDIAYYHAPIGHCPAGQPGFTSAGVCDCDPQDNFDDQGYSCTSSWKKKFGST